MEFVCLINFSKNDVEHGKLVKHVTPKGLKNN